MGPGTRAGPGPGLARLPQRLCPTHLKKGGRGGRRGRGHHGNEGGHRRPGGRHQGY